MWREVRASHISMSMYQAEGALKGQRSFFLSSSDTSAQFPKADSVLSFFATTLPTQHEATVRTPGKEKFLFASKKHLNESG